VNKMQKLKPPSTIGALKKYKKVTHRLRDNINTIVSFMHMQLCKSRNIFIENKNINTENARIRLDISSLSMFEACKSDGMVSAQCNLTGVATKQINIQKMIFLTIAGASKGTILY